MKKITVIGSSGSGKSTFSALLGKELNLPVHHLDQLYWKPNWVKPPKEDWIKVQSCTCDSECWIIDGNYQSTLDIRLKACDTVIFLDINRYACIYRALKRIIFSSKRQYLADGCNERFDIDFINFIWEYPEKSKPVIMDKLKALKSKKRVIIAKSGKQVLRLCNE